MNVLRIIDQDHQRCVIEVEQSSKFKGTESLTNQGLMGYYTQNRATRTTHFRKRKRKLLLKIEKKESKNQFFFEKLLE